MAGTLLSAEQVAERLGLNPRTVKNMANRGDIDGVMIGHAWRFDESDVEAFIARQRAKTKTLIKMRLNVNIEEINNRQGDAS